MPTPALRSPHPTAAPLTVAIVDDEPLARKGMRTLVARAGFRVVAEAGSGSEAYDTIVRTRPDVALVDVQMPDGSGLQAIARIPEAERPMTVFVTAYEQHAVHAFGVRAVDYVLKPFTDDRLAEALERARAAHGLRMLAARTAQPRADWPHQIVVRSLGRAILVPVPDVRWIEAVGYYVRLHTARGTLLHRESLESLARRLDPECFVRVHRSAIVAVEAIGQARRRRTGGHELVLTTSHRVPVSRAGWAALRRIVARDAGRLVPD
jgi:two-component system, LytTR family, response regulator